MQLRVRFATGWLLFLMACASSGHASIPTGETLLLRIRNDNPADVRVYGVRETLEIRLGMVTSFRTEYFSVPSILYGSTGRLRIKVVPVGGGPVYVTDPILIIGIRRIDLRLVHPFAHSAIFVR